MDTSLIEWLGYAASLLVVASLAMTSIVKLRIVSLIGSGLFGIYGVLIAAPPIVITNVVIVAINLWFLTKVLSTQDRLIVVPAGRNDPVVVEFIEHHRADIEVHADPAEAIDAADVCFLLLRNDTIAGVFLGLRNESDSAVVVSDYVTGQFRDLKNGKSLYKESGRLFRDMGIHSLHTRDLSHPQSHYLREVGFAEADGMLLRSFPPGP